jgi:hypothetical protein
MKSNKFSPNFSGSNAPEVQDTSLVPFSPPISTSRVFFSLKQRIRALMRGLQPDVGGKRGEEQEKKINSVFNSQLQN